MSSIFQNKTKYYFCFAAMLILQVALIVFWGNKRENLYWDEYYTYETVNYYYDNTADEHYIVDDKDFEFNKWYDNDWAFEKIVVDEKDTVTNKPLIYILKKPFLITPYFALLSVLQGVFSLGKLSIWPAIIANIVFFILTQMVLNSIALKVTNSKEISLICNAVYGFAGLTISMGIFVRSYMWATFAMTFVVWCHLKHWEENDTKKIISYEILALFFTYEAYLDAEFVVVWYAILFVVYSIFLIICKKKEKICLYTVPITFIGVVYVVFFSQYFYVLFHLREVLSLGGTTAMSAMLNYVYQMEAIDIVKRPIEILVTTSNRMFGSWIVVLLGVVGLAIVWFKYSVRVNSIANDDAFCVVSNTEKFSFDQDVKAEMTKFGDVILFTSLLCFIFSTYMCLYVTTRYISYFFPQFALSIVFLCERIWKNREKKNMYACLSVMILIGLIVTCTVPRIDFIYKGDRAAINHIKSANCNNFVTFYSRGMSDPHDTYELIYIAGQGDDAQIYACNIQEPIVDELRDEMIISVNTAYPPDMEKFEEFMNDNRYKYELIDSTYIHNYYKATKM